MVIIVFHMKSKCFQNTKTITLLSWRLTKIGEYLLQKFQEFVQLYIIDSVSKPIDDQNSFQII